MASGLQVEKLTTGTGAEPKAGNVVVVHYTGWLTDGKSSIARWIGAIRSNSCSVADR